MTSTHAGLSTTREATEDGDWGMVRWQNTTCLTVRFCTHFPIDPVCYRGGSERFCEYSQCGAVSQVVGQLAIADEIAFTDKNLFV